MKNNVIEKINKLGKVSNIIAKISMAFIGVIAISSLIFAITCFIMPKDFLSVSFSDGINATVDFSGFSNLSESEISQIKSRILSAGGGFKLNEKSYVVTDITDTTTNLSIIAESSNNEFNIKNISYAMLMGFVLLAAMWIAFFFIASLCKELTHCETPFSEIIIKKLNRVAFSLIPITVLSTTGESFIRGTLSGSSSLTLNVNLLSLVMILLIFGLVQIFKYGAALQRESDETL